MRSIFFGSIAACLFSASLASYGGYGGGLGPYNYGFGYSGIAFPYIPYGYHGAKFLTEVKAAKLRGALYDGHPSSYAQYGGHGYVGYPSKSKLDYSLNGIPNAGYGYGGGGPGQFDGRSNVAAAADGSDSKLAGLEQPQDAASVVDGYNNNNAAALPTDARNNFYGAAPASAQQPFSQYLTGRVSDAYNGASSSLYSDKANPTGTQAPMGAGYGGSINPYSLYGRYLGPFNGGYAQQKTAFGPSGAAFY